MLAVGGIAGVDVAALGIDVNAEAALEPQAVERLGRQGRDAASRERFGIAVAVDEASVVRNDIEVIEQMGRQGRQVVCDGGVGAARGRSEANA